MCMQKSHTREIFDSDNNNKVKKTTKKKETINSYMTRHILHFLMNLYW